MSRSLDDERSRSPSEPVIDQAMLEELRGFGDAFLLELIEQFAAEMEPLLSELRDAFGRNDPVAVGRIVHSIKGSGAQLGGLRLTRACNRLERRANHGFLPEGRSELEAVEREYDDLSLGLTFAATLG